MTPEELIAKYGNERDCVCGYAPNSTTLPPNLDDQLYDILAEGGGNRAETIQRIKALFGVTE